MKKYLVLLMILQLMHACTNDENEKFSKVVNYRNYNRSVYVFPKAHEIIEFFEIENENQRQVIILDKSNKITKIQNIISIWGDSSYVNTWIGLDSQGNFSPNLSYVFETYFLQDGDKTSLECHLPNLLYENSRCYVLIGKFDNYFHQKSEMDTIWFNKNYSAIIPLNNLKFGKNNIKFVIVEDKLANDTLYIKKTYVNKDFQVEKSNSGSFANY